jgi:L-lactate dehydrogenase (cytochrome)
VQRQLPKWGEIKPLLQLRRPSLRPVERRLGAALSIDELRDIAMRTTPRAVFDYVDGAADAEVTARKNREAFTSVELVPDYLQPVAEPTLSTMLLGREIAMPLVFAPTGYTRMMHHNGEAAVARVASRCGLPYTLSTVGTSTIEEVAAAAPDGTNWFQLYLTKDQGLNLELLKRAEAAGCGTVMLTVDTPVAARHLKDIRNGLTIPPSMTPKTILDMALHPGWSLNKLTTAPITFASLTGMAGASLDAVRVADVVFEPTLSYRHLDWLRERWQGKLLVKGIVSAENARRAVEHGADGVVVSNHGGRQLDRSPSTLSVLPGIREAVGPDTTVLLDSGVTRGADIIAARALGADAVMIGRAYLYGLMAGGERGVERALQILREEYVRSLQLLGLNATDAISRNHVRIP